MPSSKTSHASCKDVMAHLFMKILLLIALSPYALFAQIEFESPDEDNPYKSKQEDIYYQNSRYGPFRPKSIEEVKKHGLKHIKVIISKDTVRKNVQESQGEKLERDLKFLNPSNLTKGSEYRNKILEYSNDKANTATLFLSPKYDEFMWGEPGYWINLKDGKESHDYYTGLAQNYYIRILDNGKNIWKNDSTLEFCGVRVRLIEPFIHPVQAPRYEAIESVIVEISISDLTSDRDADGLTDIEEDKLMLNPLSKDSDLDGIVDSQDPNPRFPSVINNETLVYKAILDNFINDTIKIRDGKIVDGKRPSLIHTLKPRTRLIVSDDVDLQNVHLEYDQTIIVTPMEYESLQVKYPVTVEEVKVSPLFSIDDVVGSYVISVYGDLGGTKYLVKKVKNGYDIRRIQGWIH